MRPSGRQGEESVIVPSNVRPAYVARVVSLILAALIGAAADRTNFAGTLRREITARFCADSDELHSLVATGVVDAIVADLDTVRHSHLWPSVRAIVDWHPTIP